MNSPNVDNLIKHQKCEAFLGSQKSLDFCGLCKVWSQALYTDSLLLIILVGEDVENKNSLVNITKEEYFYILKSPIFLGNSSEQGVRYTPQDVISVLDKFIADPEAIEEDSSKEDLPMFNDFVLPLFENILKSITDFDKSSVSPFYLKMRRAFSKFSWYDGKINKHSEADLARYLSKEAKCLSERAYYTDFEAIKNFFEFLVMYDSSVVPRVIV